MGRDQVYLNLSSYIHSLDLFSNERVWTTEVPPQESDLFLNNDKKFEDESVGVSAKRLSLAVNRPTFRSPR